MSKTTASRPDRIIPSGRFFLRRFAIAVNDFAIIAIFMLDSLCDYREYCVQITNDWTAPMNTAAPTHNLDIVASRDGYLFGFHREVEAETYRAAVEATRQRLRADGWAIIKIRRALAEVAS